MKKCGIITYHFAVNYGAKLQCFALKKAVENNGVTVEVLNYVTSNQQRNNSLYRGWKGKRTIIKNCILLPFHFIRKKREKKNLLFDKQYLKNDSKIIRNIDDLMKYVNGNSFTHLISGSDQVWNPNILDFSEAFFFPFQTVAVKAGYAISTGDAKTTNLKKYDSYINDFSILSAREETTKEIINSVYEIECPIVCDPVFLLDNKFWESLTKEINMKRYLFCYFIKTTKLDEKMKIAESIAKQLNLKIVNFSARITKYNFLKKTISDGDPIDFISWLSQAEYVCTDSFHGTAFSLIFNKKFTTIELEEEKNDGRKTGLLSKVGSLESIHYIGKTLNINNNIDYTFINEHISEMREDALKYLKKVIDSTNNDGRIE